MRRPFTSLALGVALAGLLAGTWMLDRGAARAEPRGAGAAVSHRHHTPPVPPSQETPAPHILPFAQLPATPPATSALPEAAALPESAVPHVPGNVPIPEGSDGCDHAYGDRSQCVPWRFPPGVTDRCGWLRAHGFGALSVTGRDRHQIDTNHDGIACGLGDGLAR